MANTNKFKIWTADSKSAAGFMVTPKAAIMAGSPKNFIAADETGVAIVGRSISLATTGENIRQGGIFVGSPDLMAMIPSTSVTPLPNLIPFPPIAMVSSIIQGLPFFMAMLAK